MIMVIGGAYQGKKAFAAETYGIDENAMVNGAEATLEELLKCKAVYDLHLFIANCIRRGDDPAAAVERIIQDNPDLIIISNEVGYGLVPIDPFERRWREATGRCCTRLASVSGKVWRVMCGVGVCIKGA